MTHLVLTSDEIHKRIGMLDPEQVKIWQAMSPARRLDLARHAADAARSEPGQVTPNY